MDIASTIKKLCEERKISVNSLEKTTGIGRGNIGRWDRVSPSFDKVIAVADALDLSLDELAGRDVRTDLFENKKLALLLSASEDLRPEDLDILVNMAERLRESYRDV